MITLMQLVESTAWLQPQDHMRVSLWHKEKVYTEDEFEDIELNVKNLAKYANYYVSDIDVDYGVTDDPILVCMIWQ